jgi:hypothetical protein
MILAIVDLLHNDKPSLKACSLVCKAWTYLARLHLFSRLTLTWPLQRAAFPFVRHLEIPMEVRLGYGAPSWERLFPLLIGFHRITSLTVVILARSRTFNNDNAKTWSALGRTFPGVVSLSLTYCSRHEYPSSIARAIYAFPSLQRLSLEGSIPTLERAYATTLQLSPHLDTLELNVRLADAVMDWLVSLPVRPALRAVRLYDLQDTDLPMFYKFIRAFGNGLESLSLSPPRDGMLPSVI